MKKTCPRCHSETNVTTMDKGICVICSDKEKQAIAGKITKAEEAFNKMIEEYGDKMMQCSNIMCSAVATIKEAHEGGWKAVGHRMYFCPRCQNMRQAFNVKFSF